MKTVMVEKLDAEAVSRITQTTISEIYPKYYPAGAVDFFREHHSCGGRRSSCTTE